MTRARSLATEAPTSARRIAVRCPVLANEQGGRMIWLLSWLVGDDGSEGAWFYHGRGGDKVTAEMPREALGVRIYRWPNEGLDPEYADVDLDGSGDLDIADVDFDRPQRHNRISAILRSYGMTKEGMSTR